MPRQLTAVLRSGEVSTVAFVANLCHHCALSGPAPDRPGQFPRPVKLSARAVGWRESDIVAWIEARETTDA